MVEVLVVSTDIRAAHYRAVEYGYVPNQVKVVRSLDDIRGFRSLPMLFAGEIPPDDSRDILVYADTHSIYSLGNQVIHG